MKLSRLALMTVLMFLLMFVLMYLMVDTLGNAIPNLNQVYMAGIMTAGMIILEIFLMGGMYEKRQYHNLIIGLSGIVLTVFILLLRRQTGIADKEFLRSMIPHHGAAILMCNNAQINDPDIEELCQNILSSQQQQIDWMQAKLELLSN